MLGRKEQAILYSKGIDTELSALERVAKRFCVCHTVTGNTKSKSPAHYDKIVHEGEC